MAVSRTVVASKAAQSFFCAMLKFPLDFESREVVKGEIQWLKKYYPPSQSRVTEATPLVSRTLSQPRKRPVRVKGEPLSQSIVEDREDRA